MANEQARQDGNGSSDEAGTPTDADTSEGTAGSGQEAADEKGKGRQRPSALRRAKRIFRAKHGEEDEDDALPQFRAPADAPIEDAPQTAGSETRALLKALKRQQEIHLKAEMAEANELTRRAKQISEKVKGQQKLRKEVSKHYEYVQSIAEELGFDPNRPVTTVPPVTDPAMRVVDTITIQPGIAYVRILYNEAKARHEYTVIEPNLSRTEAQILSFVRDTLVRTLDSRNGSESDAWEEQLLAAVERVILDHSILVDDVARQKLQYYILRDFLGYGPIDVLMQDPMVEDISCDGPGVPVFLYHRQYESIRTNIRFDDELTLDSFVIRLGQRSGKHISIADPLLDATLPDKSRLQATLAREITTRGSSFTIRRFRSDPLTPSDLVRLKTWSPAIGAYFWFAMQEGNSILYAGGTASGKTTALNAMGVFIPPEKKIVSIEDTREINLPHENWIAGVTRSGFGSENAAGKRSGEVNMFKLLEAALRQRPEYLIVGEVRGPEAQTLFQAMATGHATYSTVHADSAASAVYRLENEPISVPRMMLQTADIIAVQIQTRVGDHIVRRVKEVVEVVGMDPETGDLLTNKVFEWDPATDEYHYLGNSHVLDLTRQKKACRAEEIETEWNHRTRAIRWMVENGIRSIDDVSSIISSYYSDPDGVNERVREWEVKQARFEPEAHRHPTDLTISEEAASDPAFTYEEMKASAGERPEATRALQQSPEIAPSSHHHGHEPPRPPARAPSSDPVTKPGTRRTGHPNDPDAAHEAPTPHPDPGARSETGPADPEAAEARSDRSRDGDSRAGAGPRPIIVQRKEHKACAEVETETEFDLEIDTDDGGGT